MSSLTDDQINEYITAWDWLPSKKSGQVCGWVVFQLLDEEKHHGNMFLIDTSGFADPPQSLIFGRDEIDDLIVLLTVVEREASK